MIYNGIHLEAWPPAETVWSGLDWSSTHAIGKRGREIVRQRFTREQMVRETEDFIELLVERNRTGR